MKTDSLLPLSLARLQLFEKIKDSLHYYPLRNALNRDLPQTAAAFNQSALREIPVEDPSWFASYE